MRALDTKYPNQRVQSDNGTYLVSHGFRLENFIKAINKSTVTRRQLENKYMKYLFQSGVEYVLNTSSKNQSIHLVKYTILNTETRILIIFLFCHKIHQTAILYLVQAIDSIDRFRVT